MTPLDVERLDQALALAENAIGLSDPNPRVGCVIGHEDGRVLGTGSTQLAGSAHAEVMALRQAQAAGHDTRGATAWVTLEPCAHHGRTPPCADALIAAGLARVVAATVDPNPRVAGRGLQRLRDARLGVELADEATALAARELNIGFFSRHERGRPWVRLKVAATLDGRTSLPDGTSQWITGAQARADGHAWRRRAGAVLTGIGTALSDDPRLDVRLVATTVQPLRVVVDSGLRLPVTARLLAAPGQALVVGARADGPAAALLRRAGAEVWACPGAVTQVDLAGVLQELGRRDVNEVHVEAGPRLNGALIENGLVDELLVYMAPSLLGPGLGFVDWPTLPALAQAHRWRIVEATMVGEDLRLRLRAPAHGKGIPPVENFDILATHLPKRSTTC